MRFPKISFNRNLFKILRTAVKKVKKFIICMFITLKSIAFAQHAAPQLAVWIRAGGPAVKTEIISFVQKVLQTLPPSMTSEVLICTNENDLILNELDTITRTCKTVKVIFSQLSSFSGALTSLAQHTDL